MSASKIRGKKWTVEEDEALCLSWLHVSQDGATGTNQKLDTMYNRIYDMFVELCSNNDSMCNPELRAPSGLKARWLAISKACSKFAGCLAQISARQQSGASPADVLKQALALYNVTMKSPFALLHAYKILENAPKWKQYHDAKVPAANVSKRRRSNGDTDDGYGDTTQDSAADVPFVSPSRPMGRKACKKLQQLQGSSGHAALQMAKAGNLLAEAAKEKAILSKERTQAINRMVNHSVMSVDMSKLSETAREYYEIEQKRILEQITAENQRASMPMSDAEDCACDDVSNHANDVDEDYPDDVVEEGTDDVAEYHADDVAEDYADDVAEDD